MKRILLFIIIIAFTQNLFSWGKNGHRIMAQICYDNLSKKAKSEVDDALGNNYLTQISTWADYIRSERNWKFVDPWHYATIAPNKTVQEVIDETSKNDKIDNIIEAIILMESILKDDAEAINKFQKLMDKNKVKPLEGSIKATALALLIHFIGDIHQPLHVGKNRDLGGNKITVLFFSERTNIHSVWDSKIINYEKLSFTEFSAFIQKHKLSEKEACEKDPVAKWAEESIIARERIYNTLYDNTDREAGLPSFSYKYQHDFLPVVEDRLAKAGFRAAEMLNSIFK